MHTRTGTYTHALTHAPILNDDIMDANDLSGISIIKVDKASCSLCTLTKTCSQQCRHLFPIAITEFRSYATWRQLKTQTSVPCIMQSAAQKATRTCELIHSHWKPDPYLGNIYCTVTYWMPKSQPGFDHQSWQSFFAVSHLWHNVLQRRHQSPMKLKRHPWSMTPATKSKATEYEQRITAKASVPNEAQATSMKHDTCRKI